MNNWEKLGFEVREQGMLHILNFLKLHEKVIVKAGLGTSATILLGDNVLTLGKEGEEKGFAKKMKEDKKK